MKVDHLAGHVAVLIVGFRNVDDIKRCLEALDRSTHADYEIVVCENGGGEAFDALRTAISDRRPGGQPVKLVQAPENLGFAGGVNLCLANAPAADAWWILNPDTEPAPDALQLMLARLVLGGCDAVGCTLYLPDGRVQSYGGLWRSWLARAESLGIGARLEAAVDPAEVERVQNYLNGASMLVGRRFLDVAGPMREDYFLYCEEVEWCLRAVSRGLVLGFAQAARVLHRQGTTTGAGGARNRQPRLPVYLGERNKVLLTRDLFPRRVVVATVAAVALLLLRYGRYGAWRQIGYGLAGLRAGLGDERGRPAWLAA